MPIWRTVEHATHLVDYKAILADLLRRLEILDIVYMYILINFTHPPFSQDVFTSGLAPGENNLVIEANSKDPAQTAHAQSGQDIFWSHIFSCAPILCKWAIVEQPL